MANATFTAETAPTGVGPGTRWYQPSTGQWRVYNASTEQWDMLQDGFGAVKVADLTVSGSVTVGASEGVTGEYEADITFVSIKKIKVVNGIITELEVEE